MSKQKQLVNVSKEKSSKSLVANAIKNQNLYNFIQTASIEDEIDKSQCFHDLIHYHGVKQFDLKAEVYRCLMMFNKGLTDRRKLSSEMMDIVVDLVLNDFSGLTIVGFFKCIRKGMSGEYGDVYSVDVLTITNWVQKYLSAENYARRIDLLRDKHDKKKNDELNSMYKSDMAELMKAALKMTEGKKREYHTSEKRLNQFKQIIKTYSIEELNKSLKDWKLRQRSQYVELLQNELLSRSEKK